MSCLDVHDPDLRKMVQPGDLRALHARRDARGDGGKLFFDLRIEEREIDRTLAEPPGDCRGDDGKRPEQGQSFRQKVFPPRSHRLVRSDPGQRPDASLALRISTNTRTRYSECACVSGRCRRSSGKNERLTGDENKAKVVKSERLRCRSDQLIRDSHPCPKASLSARFAPIPPSVSRRAIRDSISSSAEVFR